MDNTKKIDLIVNFVKYMYSPSDIDIIKHYDVLAKYHILFYIDDILNKVVLDRNVRIARKSYASHILGEKIRKEIFEVFGIETRSYPNEEYPIGIDVLYAN